MASVYGSQPSKLEKPLSQQGPSTEELLALFDKADAFGPEVEPTPSPSQEAAATPVPTQVAPVPAGTPVPGAPSTGDLLAQFDAEFEGAEPEDASVLERTKLSFARGENEQRQVLEKSFGEDNVKQDENGEWLFRRKEGEKFKRVDPDTWELFNDLFADNAREILESTVQGGLEVAGTVGLVAAAPETAGTSLLGLGAIGAASGVAADVVGQSVAENVVGIERDPERSRALEIAGAGALGGIFGAAGGAVSKFLGNRAAQKAAKAELVGVENLPQQTQQFVKAVDELEKTGLTVTVEGADGKPVKFLASQLESEDPAVKAGVERLRQDPRFVQMQKELGDQSIENVNTILKSVGDTAGLKGVAEAAGKEANISERVVAAVRKIEADEGKKIGEFKKLAKDTGKGTWTDPKNSKAVRDDVFSLLGMDPAADDFSGLTSEALSRKLVVDDSPSVKALVDKIKEIHSSIRLNGGLTADSAEELAKEVGRLNLKPDVRKDVGLKRLVGKLSSALRSDRNDIVEAALPESAKGEFRSAMAKYSNIRESTQQVSELIADSPMARDAFVGAIFNKGKQGLADLRAAKSVIEADNPALWREVKGEFLDKVIRKVTKDGTEPLSIKAFSSELNSFGPDFKKELLENNPVYKLSDLNNALTVARQYERTSFKSLNESQQEEAMRALVKGFSAFKDTQINSAKTLFNQVFSEDAQNYLTQKGVDKLLTSIPKADRAKVGSRIKDILKISGRAASKEIQAETRRLGEGG